MRSTGHSPKLSATGPDAPAPGLLRRIGARIGTLCIRLARASARYRQRRHLAELDDHQLADIGLTRRDVERECAKPFWRA
ncbi:DUF1127 domain-containing protein [Nitratireductor pacificus]|uniref:YjiS-like domain-containing protein n=1 Tax=Nitratireductor pacificus pht-3B TaxID=391937 RepID=K2N4V7_9HYPH|nr:DUF1127 domain-containing protein [Nitratireductor pacificus]EKF19223.1 hypothetical protein NA2_08836 [Nitratireductor pacificus pht-3B]